MLIAPVMPRLRVALTPPPALFLASKESASVCLLVAARAPPPPTFAQVRLTLSAARRTSATLRTAAAPACRLPNALESLTLATALALPTSSAASVALLLPPLLLRTVWM